TRQIHPKARKGDEMPKEIVLSPQGVLQGSLGGKLVTAVLHPSPVIPKGQYQLLPAVDDPIYGPLVPLVPVHSSSEALGAQSGMYLKDVATAPLLFNSRADKDRAVGLNVRPASLVLNEYDPGNPKSGDSPSQTFILSSKAV